MVGDYRGWCGSRQPDLTSGLAQHRRRLLGAVRRLSASHTWSRIGKALRERPPHILLTNYKMLDFLMIRPADRRLWRHNQPSTLCYLVVDELLASCVAHIARCGTDALVHIFVTDVPDINGKMPIRCCFELLVGRYKGDSLIFGASQVDAVVDGMVDL